MTATNPSGRSRYGGSRSMDHRAAISGIIAGQWQARECAAIAVLLAVLALVLASSPVSANIEGNNSVMANFPGNSTTTDISTRAHIFTPNENVTYNTTNPKYGSAAWFFTNATVCMITGDGSSDFAFNSSDFSISMWFYVHAYDGSNTAILYDGRPASGSGAYPYLYISGNALVYYVNGAHLIDGSTQGITKDTWHYVKLTRIGSYTSLYLDGVNQSLPKYDANNYLIPSGRPYIGSRSTTGSVNGFTGMMDDIGVRKGNGTVSNRSAVPDTEFVNNPKSSISPSATSGTAPLSTTLTDTSIGNTDITSHRLFLNNVTGNNTWIIASTATSPTLTLGVGNFSLISEASNQFGISNSTPVFVNVSPSSTISIGNLSNTTWSRLIALNWTPGGYSTLYLYKNNILYKTYDNTIIGEYIGDLEPVTNYTFSFITDNNATWINKTIRTEWADPTLPTLMVDFDDNHESVWDTAFPIMYRCGIRGNLMIVGTRLEYVTPRTPKPGYLSVDNITTMYNAGWDVVNHGDIHTSTAFIDYTQAEQIGIMVNGTANLTRFNWTRAAYHYAYRGGGYNDTAIQSAHIAGMLTARSVDVGTRIIPGYPFLWNMSVNASGTNGTVNHNPTRIKAAILASTGPHEVKDLLLHDIVTDYPAMETTDSYSVDNFTELMEWARDIGLRVNTTTDFYAANGGGGLVAQFTPDGIWSVWAPACVAFRDASTGSPTAWSWDFGDGTTGMEQNPLHCYYMPGVYPVVLNASTSSAYSLNQSLVQVMAP
jgi:hypothetical protein